MAVLRDVLAVYDRQVSIHRGYALHSMRPPFERLSGVPHSSISNWRTGKSRGRLDLVEAVANGLGYDMVLRHRDTGEIFTLPEEPTAP